MLIGKKLCLYLEHKKKFNKLLDGYQLVWAYTHMYLPNPSAWAGFNTRPIFMWSLTGLNLVFLLDWLPYQGQRVQSALIFNHSWWEIGWVHTFL